jgi:hypothetical protein
MVRPTRLAGARPGMTERGPDGVVDERQELELLVAQL